MLQILTHACISSHSKQVPQELQRIPSQMWDMIRVVLVLVFAEGRTGISRGTSYVRSLAVFLCGLLGFVHVEKSD
jgi:hypothetical protein